MSFRCLFILRMIDSDIIDSQPFCYKSFSNFNKLKTKQNNDIISIPNFNDWYELVISTVSKKTYSQFNEISIKEYISNPIYKIKIKEGYLLPCVLINLGNYIFGGVLNCSSDETWDIKECCGRAVDFVIGFSQYFTEIIKRNSKIKMLDLLPDFYHFIRLVCPYGTPVTSSLNLVDFVRSTENVLKSMNTPTNERSILSVNQIPINTANKSKEIRITVEEIITGLLHESRNGDLRHDIEIVGEISISASNLNVNSEIAMTLSPNAGQKLFNSSRLVLMDLVLHPSCIFCDFKSPVNISMLNRRSACELQDNNPEDSSPSPSQSMSNRSIVQKSLDLDNTLLTRRLQMLTHSVSVNSEIDYEKLSTISVRVKPWADTYTLMSYRFMQYPDDKQKPECNVPFITSLRSPDPPLLGTYQFEDLSMTPDAIGNIIFRLNVNLNVIIVPEKNKSVEFSRLEVILPFPNRPPLLDVSKCTVSQGKLTILEQNRHIMVWSLGSTFKNRNEASLMGSIRFASENIANQYVDQFCVGSNAYAQVNFAFKSNNVSGLSIDSKTFKCTGDRNIKFTCNQESKSFNFKIWNTMGDCPMEIQN